MNKHKKSSGEIYVSCPDLDFVIEFLDTNHESFPSEDLIEVKERLERVRKINESLRNTLSDLSFLETPPYKFSAIIKTIKIKFNNDPKALKIIEEVLETYK